MGAMKPNDMAQPTRSADWVLGPRSRSRDELEFRIRGRVVGRGRTVSRVPIFGLLIRAPCRNAGRPRLEIVIQL
jgi:hypothetical protein